MSLKWLFSALVRYKFMKIFCTYRRGTLIYLSHLFLIGFCASFILVNAKVVTAQGFNFNDDAMNGGALIEAPREFARLYDEAEEAGQRQAWTEASLMLGLLLGIDESVEETDTASQDYFEDRKAGSTATESLRAKALRYLDSLPDAGNQVIELRYGVIAKQTFDKAVAQSDWTAIRNVIHRYSFTEAGREAMWLYGEELVGRGMPLDAAVVITELMQQKRAQRRFGASGGLFAAACWKAAEMNERAKESIEWLKNTFPKESVSLGTKKVSLDSSVDEIFNAIELGTTKPAKRKESEPHWVGGSLSRNSDTNSGLPLPIVNWQQFLHESIQHEEGAAKTIKLKLGDRGATLIPTRVPIVVPPWVLVMTYDQRINAINMRTGKVDWPASFSGIPYDVSYERFSGRDGQSLNLPVHDYLAKRIWGEAATAQLSTDGQRIFCISELPSIDAADSISLGVHANVSRPITRRTYNCLQAFSTEKQGKLVWEVGGESGLAEPKLSGVLFIGAPMVYQDELIILGELNGEIFLFSLTPSNGRLNWQQQLAANPSLPLASDPTRRNLSSSPTIAGGYAICSTLSGQLIAFDLTTRTLKWARKYEQNSHASSHSRVNVWGVSQSGDFRPLEMRSADSAPVVVNGCVVHAPSDGESVYAVDLVDGHELWEMSKNSILYVAGGWDDKVLLIGDQAVHCVYVKSKGPDPVWETKTIPLSNIGRVVGRGARNGKKYYLPMSSQEIIEIDLVNGTISDRMRVESTLGNLIATKDQLIMVSPIEITAYAIRDRLRAEIDLEFAQGGNSATALQRKGKLLLGENKISEALESLEKAYKLNPKDDEIRLLLPKVALRAMRDDFAKYAPRVANYEELILSVPERSLYLISVIDGLTKSGKSVEAIKKLFELTDNSRESYSAQWSRNESIEPETELQVQQDQYVATRMAQLFESANAQDRATITGLLKDRLAKKPRIVDSIEVHRRSDSYRWLPSAAPLRLSIAEALINQGDLLLAEQVLEEVAEVAKQYGLYDENLNSQIESMRISIYNAARRWTSAAVAANRVGQSVDSVDLNPPAKSELDPVDNRFRRNGFLNNYSNTGEEMTRDDLTRFMKGVESWPKGKPVVEVVEPERAIQNVVGSLPCVIKDCVGTALQGWNVYVQQGAIDLVGPTGQQRLTVPFDNNALRGGVVQPPNVYFIDSIVIVELQSELIAIDSLKAADVTIGMNSLNSPILWRESFSKNVADELQGMSQSRTRVTKEKMAWGAERIKNRRGFVVGPVSRKGILVAWDNTLVSLDPRTKTRKWVRSGIGNLPSIVVNGNRVAVLDHLKSERSILDLRDGKLISKTPWKDTFESGTAKESLFEVWTTCGENVVSTFVNAKANNSIVFKLWNVFTNEVLLERKFSSDVRAEVLTKEDDGTKLPGLLVAWQANGEMIYWNLSTAKEVVHEYKMPAPIRAINLERFGESVVVLPYAPSLKLEMIQDEEVERFRKVSGPMIAINATDGKPLWKSPVLVNDFRFPIAQTRSTPALTLVRPLRFKAGAVVNMETGSIAILDVRNGNLLYTNNYLYSARGIEFQSRSKPGDGTLAIQYKGTEVQLNWNDEEENKSNENTENMDLPEQIGKIDRNTLQAEVPQELLERLQSGAGSSRTPGKEDGSDDPFGN